MSLTFPASPSVGDTYTVGARTWTWSGTIWEITGTVAAAGSIGTTEWQYLGLAVTPVKGLTVIWPTDWMYLHRGVTSPTQNKTIATGWFSFRPLPPGDSV